MVIERITVVFTEEDAKRVREIQGTLLKKSARSVSFSMVVSLLMKDGIQSGKWKNHPGFQKKKVVR